MKPLESYRTLSHFSITTTHVITLQTYLSLSLSLSSNISPTHKEQASSKNPTHPTFSSLATAMVMESLNMILNSSNSSTEEEEEEEEEHDEGPFIDLDFSIPDADSEDSENSTLSLSPSNDLFSLDYTNTKPHPFPSSLLKSKFRIFALRGSKKPKPTSTHPSSPKQMSQNTPANYFVRFKVEQVPLVSLFTRENGEKVKSSKKAVNKYFNKIKKLRFSSGQVASVVAVEKSGRKDGEKWQGGGSSSPLRLETVRRRLGKSRSASSTVASVRSPPRRRDDSLLQQQDGIQSAIAHCKRSFHAEKGSELQLVRSNSDPGEINQLQLNLNF